MKIRKISGKNITTLKKFSITLPETGIVLITGENGEGKSSVLNTVSTALYNISTSGVPIWRKEEAGDIDVESWDGLKIFRSNTASNKNSLSVQLPDGSALEAPTKTKLQETLNKYIPNQTVWENSCLVNQESVGRFTAATDKGRKEIIENLIGLSFIDNALKLSTEATTTAEKAITKIQQDIRDLETQQAARESGVARLKTAVSQLPEGDLEKCREEYQAEQTVINAIKTQGQAMADDLARLQTAQVEVDRRVNAINLEIRGTQGKLEQLKRQRKQMEGGKCPVCSQPVAGGDTSAIDAEITSCEKVLVNTQIPPQLKSEQEAAVKAVREKDVEIRKMQQELNAAQQKLAGLKERGTALKDREAAAAKFLAQIEQESQVISDVQTQKKKLENEFKGADSAYQVEKTAKSALGLKGLRVSLISGALASIETQTNRWFPMLFDHPVSMHLLEKNDQIILEMDGVGGGYGYKACSRGQRRRIDIAVPMAFGEVSRQAQNIESTTIFIDETFDGLDARGVEAVCEIMCEIAKRHCVVIITHMQEYITMLAPVNVYRVSNGEVIQVS